MYAIQRTCKVIFRITLVSAFLLFSGGIMIYDSAIRCLSQLKSVAYTKFCGIIKV